MSRFTVLATDRTQSPRAICRTYKAFNLTQEGVIESQIQKLSTYFKVKYEEFNNIWEMSAIIESVIEHGDSFIVRGDVVAEQEAHALAGLRVRRTKHYRHGVVPGFQPANRDWVMLDIDKLQLSPEEWEEFNPLYYPNKAIEYILSRLPIYFHNVSCWWQFSASQNVHSESTTLSAHMFFMLDRMVEDETLRLWAASHSNSPGGLPIDPNVFECVQPHFVVTPMFTGFSDPLPVRFGVYEGEYERVVFDVPDAGERYGDLDPVHTNISSFINMRKLKPHLDAIGDDPGQMGFNEAIKSVIGKYFQLYGPEALDLPLKSSIRKAINTATIRMGRPMQGVSSPEYYASDNYLDPIIKYVRSGEREVKDIKINTFESALERYVYVEELERFLDTGIMTFRTKTGITDGHSHAIRS